MHDLGGQKWLYAHTYYTKEEFEEIYDTKAYVGLREKYHAGYLPTVYDKVKVDVEKEERERRELMAKGFWVAVWVVFWGLWPFQGLWGVWSAFRGGDYLLPRKEKGSGEEKKEL